MQQIVSAKAVFARVAEAEILDLTLQMRLRDINRTQWPMLF